MFPPSSIANTRDSGDLDIGEASADVGQQRAGGTHAAHLADIGFGDLVHRLLFASLDQLGPSSPCMLIAAGNTLGMRLRSMGVAVVHPSFGDRIADVVELAPAEQVTTPGKTQAINFVGSDLVIAEAGRQIAGMQDAGTSGAGHPSKVPSNMMGIQAIAIEGQTAVASRGTGSGPEPAVARLVHSGPESGDERRGILIGH